MKMNARQGMTTDTQMLHVLTQLDHFHALVIQDLGGAAHFVKVVVPALFNLCKQRYATVLAASISIVIKKTVS